MKNLSSLFNPLCSELDFLITVTVGVGHNAGWKLQEYYEDNQRGYEDYSAAQERICNNPNFEIVIKIKGNTENPSVLFGHQCYPKCYEVMRDTGDSEESIKDVIKWLEAGTFKGYTDYSVDENDNHIPAFAQFVTMKDGKVGDGFIVPAGNKDFLGRTGTPEMERILNRIKDGWAS